MAPAITAITPSRNSGSALRLASASATAMMATVNAA